MTLSRSGPYPQEDDAVPNNGFSRARTTFSAVAATVGAVGALGLPSLVVAAPASAVAPSQDSVSGNVETLGTVVLPLSVRWQIAATSGPSGEAPTGTVTAASFLSGSVTCLSVERNVAQ